MRFIVERIEEEFAVLSLGGGEMINVPLCEMGMVHEGDILEYDGERYILFEKETVMRKKSLAERFEKLKNRR